MKCPKCGFVSFPDLAACKQCGHAFRQIPDPPPVSPLEISTPLSPDSPLLEETPLTQGVSESPPGPGESEEKIEFSTAVVAPQGQWWKEEVSRKVRIFRKKRAARLKAMGGSPMEVLPEEEEDSPVASRELVGDGKVLQFRYIALEEAKKGEKPEGQELGDRDLSEPDPGSLTLNAKLSGPSSLDAGEGSLGQPQGIDPPPGLDAELEPEIEPAISGYDEAPASWPSQRAPLGARCSAGLIDAMVLASASALFAGIFWLAGGIVPRETLSWAVGGLILALFAVAYFGGFTALRHATPGMIWMGLEARSIDGEPPRTGQALWRGLGYLVSAGSLMLGFLWALVDDDQLTWHDRISDTFISPTDATDPTESSGEGLIPNVGDVPSRGETDTGLF